ncbi:MAG TPA: endolytic transglycosylase MltG [Caldithrix abyssi]|uniref:Endolytic murein transglycosylase n=1 Tax=Caldithrix abyssi TaxID=187145 RepID=A0A7V1LMY9_CALAY|nr:endolytic transglycosylase MltG [Caldithrix abyssi]
MNTTQIRTNYKRFKWWQKFLIVAFPVLPWLVMALLNYFTPVDESSVEQKVTLRIPQGATLSQIGDSLLAHDLIKNKKLFTYFVKYLGYEKKLRAGVFAVPGNLNHYQMVEYLIGARAERYKITLLEGWSLKEIAAYIGKKPGLSAERFLELAHDPAFIKSLGLDVPALEGYLLPETYFLEYNIREEQLLKILVGKCLEIFKSDSARRAMINIGLNRHQVLTLASIVEGEALLDAERPIIASLYLNRLKRHMRLQADPTIQYIKEGPPGRLLFKDLEIESPYNTYLHYGLPPGPINNPGKKSILAVLFPEKTNYLYMVAVGDGSHTFTTRLKDHLKAKAQFDRVRRIVKRKQRNNQK